MSLAILFAVSVLAQQVDWSFAETPKVVAKGREWWVAPNGDDHAPGTKDRPFATITKGLASAGPGETVQVRKGRYAAEKEKLNFAASGRPDAWIVLHSADGPWAAEVDGQGKAFEVMLVSERSYVAVEGLDLHGSQDNTLHVGINCSHVVVRDCKVHGAGDPGCAIKVNTSDHVWLEGCDVSDTGFPMIDMVGVHHCVARGCFAHDSRREVTAMFAKGGSHEVLFEKNVVTGVRTAHALMLGGDTGKGLFSPDHPDVECENMMVRNNIVVDCDDSSIEVRGCRNGWVCHNTAVGCSTTFACVAVRPGQTNGGDKPSPSSNISIFNNLFADDGDMDRPYLVDDQCRQGLRTGSNLWWNGKAGVPERGGIDVGKEKGSLVNKDPRLASMDLHVKSWKEAVERFRPLADSPALGAGIAVPLVLEDILGVKRGRAPTVGAFER